MAERVVEMILIFFNDVYTSHNIPRMSYVVLYTWGAKSQGKLPIHLTKEKAKAETLVHIPKSLSISTSKSSKYLSLAKYEVYPSRS